MNHLDKKDTAIIRELDFNARMSISSLARKVRVSKEVANYRLKKLLDEKVISSFSAIIDPYMFGHQLYGLRIKFKQAAAEKKKELIEWVKTQGSTGRIVYLGGKWDLSLYFWAKNPPEFQKIYEKIITRFGSVILKKSISITIEVEHRPYNFLYDKASNESLSVGTVGDAEFDKKDAKILDALSHNCRTPLIEIAKKAGLTANAVKYRIKQLENQRIIKGYSTILNPNYFGLAHYRVTLYLSDPSKKREVREYLRSQKDVVFITELLGLGDIRFELLCPSVMRIYSLVEDLNKVKPDIVRDFDEIIILDQQVVDYFPNED